MKKKKKITVVCNYPLPENMEMFNRILYDELAKALIRTKSPEYIEAFKVSLRESIKADKLKGETI